MNVALKIDITFANRSQRNFPPFGLWWSKGNGESLVKGG